MSLILIAHNLRSTHNVGALLRTADALGVARVLLSGYTPYPKLAHDERLPHLAQKIDNQIHKTALGAELTVPWEHTSDLPAALQHLRSAGYAVYALEQAPDAVALANFRRPPKLAVILGREVEGIEPEILASCDGALEIPMRGQKESLNVIQAAAIAAYSLLY